jgi:hypothetical protein
VVFKNHEPNLPNEAFPEGPSWPPDT